MVLLIIIPMKNGYFIGNINPTFSDKPIYSLVPFPISSPRGESRYAYRHGIRRSRLVQLRDGTELKRGAGGKLGAAVVDGLRS